MLETVNAAEYSRRGKPQPHAVSLEERALYPFHMESFRLTYIGVSHSVTKPTVALLVS